MTFVTSLVCKVAVMSLFVVSVQTDGGVGPTPDTPAVARVNVANLQEQLNAGLRARRPEEFRFIADIVNMTEQGKLPFKLVLSTFDYVRTKKKDEKFPFVIFERVLRIRAAQIGIRLPAVGTSP